MARAEDGQGQEDALRGHHVVRYERHAENFLGMVHLACCLILLRCL